ncbi:hypothetical protein APHAL10511_003174 [Amanita phalloides]|nr:hypothetical protein APHAL10511_003174 [Amanita phalloides]
MPPTRATARKRRKEEDNDKTPDELHALVKVPRRRGKLAALVYMPLDILYEIFCYLTSAELLKLSRTSKAFRRVLMSSSSVTVWKVARENIGLPECPPDMIEPRWANLAFSPHCHYCFTSGVRTVEWRFRMRICSKCAKNHLSEATVMPAINGVHRSDSLVPNRPSSKRWKTVYVTAEYEKVRNLLSSLTKEEDIAACISQRKEEVTKALGHALRCEEWAKNQNEDKAMERDRLREERKRAIIEKLKELGWGRDLESIRPPDSLDELKNVREPKRLTDRIWINIQDPVLEFMAKMRRKRIERENKEIIMRRKRAAMAVLQQYKNDRLPYQEIMPEPIDFCDMQPVKAIIDRPLEVSVDVASFSHLVPEFASLFATWRDEIHLKLCRVLQQPDEPDIYFHDIFGLWVPDYEPRDVPDTDHKALEMLHLASTIFVCRDCGPSLSTFLDIGLDRPIFYPEVLGHSCLTRKFSCGLFNSDPADPSEELTSSSSTKRTKWNARPLTLSTTMRSIAEALIKESGFDPRVATTAHMDKQNLFYACVTCSDNCDDGVVAPVYKWRDAISHRAITHHLADCDWYIADEDEYNDNIFEIEDEHDDDDDDDDDNDETMNYIWCCTRCRDTPQERVPTSLSSMMDHYVIQHQFNGELTLNQDYFRAFDANKRQYSSPSKMLVLTDPDIEYF